MYVIARIAHHRPVGVSTAGSLGASAPPEKVALIGDINNDGFGDICIGLPKADFIDLSFPQGADAPNDPAVGRRRDAGDAYVVYGNNFGSNRAVP